MTTLVYADGSANVYRIEMREGEVRFTYEPVTPARSSTGTYSGGEPVDARLPADDARIAAVWREVAALEADPAQHVETRMKGDGAITVERDGEPRRFLVRRAATRALEALLAELRG